PPDVHTLPARRSSDLGRIKQDDASVPVRYRGYWYWTRYEKGLEYPILLRRRDSPEAPEEILLDCNLLAAGESFFKLGSYEVSPRSEEHTSELQSRENL